jgi:hypothetical protein
LRTVAEGLEANNWARDIQGVLGVHEIGQYLMIWTRIKQTVLTNEPDKLIWKGNSQGEYTAKSAYLATFQGSIQCKAWRMIWKSWAPPRVRFFHWEANIDRCWTEARLARRGLQHHPKCLLCDQMLETIHHFQDRFGTRSFPGCV